MPGPDFRFEGSIKGTACERDDDSAVVIYQGLIDIWVTATDGGPGRPRENCG